ncbi:MAG: hypothetical protein CVU74_09045, partial [Deltaproteobacteria bacterium HGW-Deltaproteobacteria-9]
FTGHVGYLHGKITPLFVKEQIHRINQTCAKVELLTYRLTLVKKNLLQRRIIIVNDAGDYLLFCVTYCKN